MDLLILGTSKITLRRLRSEGLVLNIWVAGGWSSKVYIIVLLVWKVESLQILAPDMVRKTWWPIHGKQSLILYELRMTVCDIRSTIPMNRELRPKELTLIATACLNICGSSILGELWIIWTLKIWSCLLAISACNPQLFNSKLIWIVHMSRLYLVWVEALVVISKASVAVLHPTEGVLVNLEFLVWHDRTIPKVVLINVAAENRWDSCWSSICRKHNFTWRACLELLVIKQEITSLLRNNICVIVQEL